MNIQQIFFIGIALIIIFWFQAGIALIILFLIFKKIYEKITKKNLTWDEMLNIFNNLRTWKGWKVFVDNLNENKFKTNFNFNQINMFNPMRIFYWIIGLVLLLLFLDWFVNVPAWNVAVIFDRWRWVLNNVFDEWLHLKIPFWQKATKISTRMQSYTMSIAPTESEAYWDDAIDALTKDGQKVRVDATIQFHLEKENAPYVYQKIWLDYVEKIVRPAARSVVREAVTWYNSKELFQIETRQKIEKQINEWMKANLSLRKITLDAVLLRNVLFSDVYLNSIEEKQVAEQKIQKAEFERQEAEKIKERKIIEAQAEAESIKLKWQALRANQEVIQLEMINKLSPNIKWWILPNSVMPLLDLKDIKE